jgi:hypothetical protein
MTESSNVETWTELRRLAVVFSVRDMSSATPFCDIVGSGGLRYD